MIVAAPGRRPATRRVIRSLRCPAAHRRVTVELQETIEDGRIVALDRCNAFDPPTAICCDRACARWLRGQASAAYAPTA